MGAFGEQWLMARIEDERAEGRGPKKAAYVVASEHGAKLGLSGEALYRRWLRSLSRRKESIQRSSGRGLF